MTIVPLVFALLFACLVPVVPGASSLAFAQAPTPVVAVQPVAVEDVAPVAEFVGRVEAIKAVDILARIDGFIQQVAFKEGQLVHAGDLLYVIEPPPYQAALSGAQAELAGAKATLANAESALARARELRQSQNVSEAAFEQVQATRDTAAASVAQAEANVRKAEINLSYTRITSPIDGRIGRTSFVAGSFVTPSSGTLSRVVQMDPIRVVFSVSDRALLDIRTRAGDVPLEELYKRFVPALRLSNGADYAQSGTIEFVGNEIDPQTGTVPVRARFANPKALLVPGQFVTVRVRPVEAQRKPVVPLGAVQQDRDGRFVLLLDDADKVVMRRIKAGAQVGQNLAVDEGLSGGERLIVQGFQNARPGAVVKAVPASESQAAAAAGAGVSAATPGTNTGAGR